MCIWYTSYLEETIMGKMIYVTKEQAERLDLALRKMQDEIGDRRLSMSAMIHRCVELYLEEVDDDQ
jgi:hypothetical protein